MENKLEKKSNLQEDEDEILVTFRSDEETDSELDDEGTETEKEKERTRNKVFTVAENMNVQNRNSRKEERKNENIEEKEKETTEDIEMTDEEVEWCFNKIPKAITDIWYRGYEKIAYLHKYKGYTKRDFIVNWLEAIPDLIERAKKQRDVIEEKERNLEISIEEWEELFTGKENNRMFIKMMIRLAMTRPIILIEYIKGEG